MNKLLVLLGLSLCTLLTGGAHTAFDSQYFGGYAIGGTAHRYTTGGITYISHTFTSSGTFLPNGTKLCDILIVGGGGSGGKNISALYQPSGGGGAGGYLYYTDIAVNKLSNIVVGAGGTSDQNGSSSSIINTDMTHIAYGGGAGAHSEAASSQSGHDGASGGGGFNRGNSVGTYSGGTATHGAQGHNGAMHPFGDTASGGGGGAGGAAPADDTRSPGVGLSSSITGTSVTYATGGRGSRNDYHGGGGADNGVAATSNTGNGGTGRNRDGDGKVGGSGIVVVRYKVN